MDNIQLIFSEWVRRKKGENMTGKHVFEINIDNPSEKFNALKIQLAFLLWKPKNTVTSKQSQEEPAVFVQTYNTGNLQLL